MDSPNSIRNSTSFKNKKWTLFSLCAIGILATILMAGLASKLVDTYLDNDRSDLTIESRKIFKATAIALIWIISILTIPIDLVGLMGAYKENYYITVIYAALKTIVALGSIRNASQTPYYWSTTILSMIICVITYAYAYDLQRIHSRTFATPIIVTTGQTIGLVQAHQTTGQPYVAGPQLNGQYGQPYVAGPQFNGQYGQPYVAGPQFNGQYGQPNAVQVMTPYPPDYTSSEQKTNY